MDFNNIKFDLPKDRSSSIKVIGVGGGGSNAVNYMFQQGITGVDFVICNTDAQALQNSSIPSKIQLGASITEGLGAGAYPEVGEQAALESLEDIKAYLEGNTKMLFITAGMGGGTGTGAAPVIANCAKEMGILTVGIVTAPFYFEGKMRLEQAKKGIENLRENVDSLIIINNDKLRELYGNLGYKSGFAKADEVLATAAKGIAEVITHHYATNIDLRDAKTVLANSGTAIMGSGKASGENKARKAIELALDSPLLNDNKITGARNVLLLIVSGDDEVTMDEIGLINEYIQQEAGHHANIIMGVGEDNELGENISVTVIATGFPVEQQSYNGKEEQQIVHRLEEDQPLTKTLSLEKPAEKLNTKPLDEEVRFNLDEEYELPKLKINPEEQLPEEQKNEEPNLFSFNEEKQIDEKPVENKVEKPHLEEETETSPLEDHEVSFELTLEEVSFQNDEDVEVEETSTEAEPNENVTLFTLEDEWLPEEETPIQISDNKGNEKQWQTPENKVSSSIQKEINKSEEPIQTVKEPATPVEEEKTPEDSSISQVLSKQIQERRDRLKKFNYKFKNSLQSNKDSEKPAYLRKGVELNEHEHAKPSNYQIEEDESKDLKIRPNNFLNDNVD